MEAETRYTRTTDGLHIAYQVFGSGQDLVFAPGWIFSMENVWEWTPAANFLRRLGSFSRLILFDRRGMGQSDHIQDPSTELTLEARMDDLRAVLESVGSTRAVLLGTDDAFGVCAVFAASHPDRVQALVGYGASPAGLWAPDYQYGWTDREWDRYIERIDEAWGTTAFAEEMARWFWPDAADVTPYVSPLAKATRRAVSPRGAATLVRNYRDTDIRDVLPLIQVPALLIHRIEDQVESVAASRYIAEHIPGAEIVELPGGNHGWVAPDQDDVLDTVEAFVRRLRDDDAEFDRILTTVLFTDIVRSTQRAVDEGDRAWGDVLEAHHRTVRAQLARYRGHEVDTAGDGFLATFDGPARAVRCAQSIAVALTPLRVHIRAGVHTGEVALEGHGVRGVAVHIGARIAALADSDEVLVSSTVRDLVAGSGITFEDRGEHELKGLPGSWRVYAALPR